MTTHWNKRPYNLYDFLTGLADYFDRDTRGAALVTPQKFDIPTGKPFSSYLRAFRVVVANTVEEGGPLAPSAWR